MGPVEFAGVAARLVDFNTEPIWPVGFDGGLAIFDLDFLCSGVVVVVVTVGLPLGWLVLVCLRARWRLTAGETVRGAAARKTQSIRHFQGSMCQKRHHLLVNKGL
ncbi:hypothetical protein KDM87_11470 [Undibacterium sp. FT147W]|uniref:Uncharacterized protein n=1 Tax=Undibacterium rivi TaxID=2828729 RepID=A0ABS5H3E9_9BURK|nr:hypothetical protein [Undibacterium rivi]MBR7793220.1 hypothetical protein [Undibacterium rivi]